MPCTLKPANIIVTRDTLMVNLWGRIRNEIEYNVVSENMYMYNIKLSL